MSIKPCKFCGAQLGEWADTPKGPRPRNPDGSMHKCDRKQKPVENISKGPDRPTEEYGESGRDQSQKAMFPPGLEAEVHRIAKEEAKTVLIGWLQWMASQAEGQA